ncbi:Thymocyte nuclear protein 1 [Penicillium hispanicum]|uniref:Thymocyte nuclear protein 1 n=1 Tax=Penicillium hispanicum TaxID=1080232 RepID=UPI002541CC52|nr:Thymocyte nuclear protein 1 [Penicillium hispanicum]KAJ5579841.1 Thymocyte nuclear protein 1 [Penicillium hispanicum]
MTPKGKSTDSAMADKNAETSPSSPSKTSVADEGTSEIAATPQTGEKRKRGRPRKNPQDSTPKPADGPKRGRGRPRKVVSEADLAAAAATAAASPATKRGRGRPRKEPGTETPKPTPKKKDGRGRPRKSLPANGTSDSPESKPEPVTSTARQEDTARSYWLMKAEPESRLEKGVDVKFSIDDLAAAKSPEPWDGVRNPVARNLMKDMKKGDYAFFYHSNCKVPGVVGIMEIVQEHSVDESAFDPKHPYHDPKATRDNPKWVVVHVEFRHKLQKQVTLDELKSNALPGKALENLQTLKQSRLSVSSVTPAQWRFILELAGEDPQKVTPQG